MPFEEHAAPMITRLLIPVCGLLLLVSTTACAPPLLIAGAAAGAAGAAVVSDRRTARVIVEDQKIESAAIDAINADLRLAEGVHVSVTSYNQIVLLTGQAPDGNAIDRVVQHVRGIDKVRSIHSHIETRAPTTLRQRSRDTLTTSRVKSALLGEEGLSSLQIKVVTENDAVYLMGMVRRSEADRVAHVVQQVDGVRQVVLVFEYIR
jgi:osmotically-inducible protein OsmY